MRTLNQKRLGFSILELTIGIAIIGLLSIVVIGPAMKVFFGAGKSKAKTEMNYIKQAVTQYKLDTGRYPSKLDDLSKKPSEIKNWQGPYLEDDVSLVDPWGNEYQYELRGQGQKPPYRIFSYGSEEGEATPEEKWLEL